MNTALITGCSSGYGHATALHFLAHGWNVVATMRTPDKAQGFPGNGEPHAERLRIVRLDVTDRASIDAAIAAGISAFGGLDVVVNNAGIGLFAPIEATPHQAIRDVFETNTFGVIAVTQAVVPHLRARRSGTVINVTSSATIAPMPLVSVYTASKCAIEGFTESLDYELSFFGACAKLVEPGYGPATRFTDNSAERILVPEAYGAYATQLMSNLSGGKTTQALDVARAVWLAATDGSRRLRYPAGPDAEELATMRRAFPGDDYVAQMRAAVGPKTP